MLTNKGRLNLRPVAAEYASTIDPGLICSLLRAHQARILHVQVGSPHGALARLLLKLLVATDAKCLESDPNSIALGLAPFGIASVDLALSVEAHVRLAFDAICARGAVRVGSMRDVDGDAGEGRSRSRW